MKIYQGFSLMEMAVVLIIIGLLMGGLLTPLSTQIDYQRIKLTEQRLETIKEALLGFAVIQERLPCPAKCYKYNDNTCPSDNFVGREDPSDTSFCNNQEGYLPWADLGVGRYDAWENPFRYRVDATYTQVAGINSLVSTSELKVVTINNNKLTNSTMDFQVVAIVFSCGKNGIPDNDNDADGTNINATCANPGTADALYIKDGYVENNFDDVLTWLSKNTLVNYLVTAGKW